MWDLIVSVPDHCLSFYFEGSQHFLFIAANDVSEGCIFRVVFLVIVVY